MTGPGLCEVEAAVRSSMVPHSLLSIMTCTSSFRSKRRQLWLDALKKRISQHPKSNEAKVILQNWAVVEPLQFEVASYPIKSG